VITAGVSRGTNRSAQVHPKAVDVTTAALFSIPVRRGWLPIKLTQVNAFFTRFILLDVDDTVSRFKIQVPFGFVLVMICDMEKPNDVITVK